jgi:pimeloyl-ACP methyl ester carboxylesterase
VTTVLLHPLPLDGSVWDDVVPLLDAPIDAPAIAPTLYDLGDTITQWAHAVLDLAGSGPVTLVGNSIGGSVAAEIAHLAPERVTALVLVGAKPGHRPEPALCDEAVRILSTDGIDAAWQRYWAPLFAPDAEPEVIDGALRAARSLPLDAIIRGVRAFHGREDRSSVIDEVRCPVVVARGEHDPISRATAAHVVPGSGHYVPIERPVAMAALVDQTQRVARVANSSSRSMMPKARSGTTATTA